MPIYRIADFLINMEPRYPLLAAVAEKYRVETDASADFTVRVTDDEIASVMALSPDYTEAYGENLSACRKVCQLAAERGAILFHAAVIEVDGKAYAFSAPSGTGKSTHIKLWRRRFGDLVKIINGDKPLLRESDDVLTVYGTPWCGKEGWNRNASAPLAGLCFLSRGEKNSIERISPEMALERVFTQLMKPSTANGVTETLRIADRLISSVPVYHLACNISEEAAEIAFRAMTGDALPPRIG